jgi:hypothetical protein
VEFGLHVGHYAFKCTNSEETRGTVVTETRVADDDALLENVKYGVINLSYCEGLSYARITSQVPSAGMWFRADIFFNIKRINSVFYKINNKCSDSMVAI